MTVDEPVTERSNVISELARRSCSDKGCFISVGCILSWKILPGQYRIIVKTPINGIPILDERFCMRVLSSLYVGCVVRKFFDRFRSTKRERLTVQGQILFCSKFDSLLFDHHRTALSSDLVPHHTNKLLPGRKKS